MTGGRGNSSATKWNMIGASLSQPWLQLSPNATLTVLAGTHGGATAWSYYDLLTVSMKMAERLSALGITRGDRVAIALPTGPHTVALMLGAWLCGAAFSIFPAGLTGGRRPKISPGRLRASLEKLKPALSILADEAAREIAPTNTRSYILREILATTPRPLTFVRTTPDDVAFVQFTSGSTDSEPKGAIIRHSQLSDNIEGIGDKIDLRDHDSMVSWAPLHHDMGLISLLLPLRYGLPITLIPTETFGRRPGIWLETISKTRGTLSAAPPFAFALLAKRPPFCVASELDLSSWRYAWVGAEPIFRSQLEDFYRTYQPCGLKRRVLQPTYGLAESVVAVASGRHDEEPVVLSLDARIFGKSGLVRECTPDTAQCIELIGCGVPNRNLEVRIGDGDGNELGPDLQGRILIRGPSVSEGYYGANSVREPDEWFDTGDLGFIHDSQVFVSGRIKELIKRSGVGIAPQEIEHVIEQNLAMRTGRAAAFSYFNHTLMREVIIVLIEMRPDPKVASGVAENLGRVLAEEVNVQVDVLHFVPLNGIPRTSSGKLQRGLARERYLAGFYGDVRTGEFI
jgi:fatty-acyl-CoA synthase